MQVWIGTSGYSYPDWVGGFYPPGTSTQKMLAYYCEHFPLVELNFTFYRPPTPIMLARMADRTPAGFQFIVKMPRTISHEERTEDVAGFKLAIEQMRQRGKLQGVLCQLPQSIHREKKHEAWIERLSNEFGEYGLAVEFRYRSWAAPDVPAWLHELRTDLVAVDVPDIPALYPSGLVQSGPHIYVRFHSHNADNWYQSDADRYNYSYDDAALKEWITAINQAEASTDRVLLLFNNCHRSQAAENAERIRVLIQQLAPQWAITAPPTSQSVRQLSLFDHD
ncbi:MAG TPA: DUF72 domain-containing protein [Gemmataceae bacterium]|nr:DUF72 domain-containing protein [Gemmataceae bacterium]